MYLCYFDESGTPDRPGNTSHFILAGLVIPIWHWHGADREIQKIKSEFDLGEAEIHTAWLLRKYIEQSRIDGFRSLSRSQRRSEVEKLRHGTLIDLQSSHKHCTYKQSKKNFKKTEPYIHLSYDEHKHFVNRVADTVSQWGFARLFAECVNKLHFDPQRTKFSVDEQAFEQVVSRFALFLRNMNSRGDRQESYGLIVHDNNETVARKHTRLMREFHKSGTFWTNVDYIIETPMFVDSQLTSMVQLADLCAYALRRYLENDEENLFERIYLRADRQGQDGPIVGVRHFTNNSCTCTICGNHRP